MAKESSPMRRYNSYLIRCWTSPDDERVEIQLLPSSQRVRFTSMKSALEWLAALNEQPGRSRACTDESVSAALTRAPSAIA
jgi:hypothetical protein